MGMTKLSNSGAGKPINALWQMKNKDVVYQRGGYWINGEWEEGTAEDLIDVSYSLILNGTETRYEKDIYYFNGYIWSFRSTRDLCKVDMAGNITNIFNASAFSIGDSGIKIDEINNKVYFLRQTNLASVCRCDLDGSNFETFGSQGSGVNQFGWQCKDLYIDTSYLYYYSIDYAGNSKLSGTLVDNPPETDPDGDIIYGTSALNLYVVDQTNCRIIKTRFDGSVWSTIGSYKDPATGYENFKFAANPLSITYAKDLGIFIVLELRHSKLGVNYISLIKFKWDLSYWERTNFSEGSGDFQLNYQGGRLLYDNGSLFITDYDSYRIIKTDINFSTWESVNLRTLVGAGFAPFGISINRSNQDLFIHSYNSGQLIKFNYFSL